MRVLILSVVVLVIGGLGAAVLWARAEAAEQQAVTERLRAEELYAATLAAELADDDADDADESEEVVPLADVPEFVKQAARDAVPGLVLDEAERETEGGAVHYCVHGTLDGEFVEVEVGLDGAVLEIEHGDDEDD